MFDAFLNVIFGPLLGLGPFWCLFFLSLIVSVITILFTKIFTNQVEMKVLKDELKKYQKQMKELKKDPNKLMEVQKKAMRVNMQYFKKSLKPTLFTFIPIILIFGWMNAHLAFEPLSPGEKFDVVVDFHKGIQGNVSLEAQGLEILGPSSVVIKDDSARFSLKGPAGDYSLLFSSNNASVEKNVVVSTARDYAPVLEKYKSDVFKSVKIKNKPLKIFGLGWIWIYIILAVIFSSVLRKLFKVY
ncbi:hypothetical protein DRJ22_00645 [Candidatus Woesearchaeota archaeon]|nr:MAG: hypothetical protein DRJ22_00645 [Candidatus Woesearchaeota archaeon]